MSLLAEIGLFILTIAFSSLVFAGAYIIVKIAKEEFRK